MTKTRASSAFLGASLLIAGFVGGSIAFQSGGHTAVAGATWNADMNSYVTGGSESLTFWKLDKGAVSEATVYWTESADGSDGTNIYHKTFRAEGGMQAMPGMHDKGMKKPGKAGERPPTGDPGHSCGAGSCGK